MNARISWTAFVLLAALLTGCGKQRPSPEDTRRDQRIDAVEKKQAALEDWSESAKQAEATFIRVEDGLNKRIDEQTASLKEMDTRVAGLQEALKATADRLAEGRDLNRDLFARMEALEKGLAKLGDSLLAAQQAAAAPNPALADAQKRIDQLKDDIDALKKSLTDAEKKNAEAEKKIAALEKEDADRERHPPDPPKATAQDIEVHHLEKVELIDKEVVLTVEGNVTNTAKSAADVEIGIQVGTFRGIDKDGKTAYKLDGPYEHQDFRRLQPGESRLLLARMVLITTSRAPNLREFTWTAEVSVSPSVR